MPSCTVCEHPQRQTIDALLASGGSSLRSIALQYGFPNHMSVVRHRKSHILARVQRAVTKRAAKNDDTFLSGIEQDIRRAARGAQHGLAAAAEGKIEPELAFRMAPAFIQASLRGRELLGRATGRLDAADSSKPAPVIIMAGQVTIDQRAQLPDADDETTIDIKAIGS